MAIDHVKIELTVQFIKIDSIYAYLMTQQLFVGKSRFYHFSTFNDTCCMAKFS